MSNFKNLSFFFFDSWTSKMSSDVLYGEISLTKLKVDLFLVGICVGGTLRMPNFKILSIFSGFGTYKSYQKCHQICSRVKFVEQN
jgi:hypothetical protein